MIICDTNILIEFYKNNSVIVRNLRHIGAKNIAISVVTIAELYYGALNKRELQQIKNHLQSLHQLPLTPDISAQCLSLMESFSLSHNLSLPDALIGATALTYGIKLYTLNLKDFRYIPHLDLHTP